MLVLKLMADSIIRDRHTNMLVCPGECQVEILFMIPIE